MRFAGHYKIDVRGSPLKADLLDMLSEALFMEGDKEPRDPGFSAPFPPVSPDPPITKAAIELRRLELKEEMTWERESTGLEADRLVLRERERRESIIPKCENSSL